MKIKHLFYITLALLNAIVFLGCNGESSDNGENASNEDVVQTDSLEFEYFFFIKEHTDLVDTAFSDYDPSDFQVFPFYEHVDIEFPKNINNSEAVKKIQMAMLSRCFIIKDNEVEGLSPEQILLLKTRDFKQENRNNIIRDKKEFVGYYSNYYLMDSHSIRTQYNKNGLYTWFCFSIISYEYAIAPRYSYSYKHFDISSGKELTFDDFFKPDANEGITEYVLNHDGYCECWGDEYYLSMSECVGSEEYQANENSFCFTDGGVEFVLPGCGNYGIGAAFCLMPWNYVKNYMKDEWYDKLALY